MTELIVFHYSTPPPVANVQYSTKRFGQCTCRPDRVTREGVIGTTGVFDDEWVSKKEGSVGGEVLVVDGCASVCGMINSVSKYAGFSRSMEMTFLRPYISTEKCLSVLPRTRNGPSYGCCSGRLTASCLMNTCVQLARLSLTNDFLGNCLRTGVGLSRSMTNFSRAA